MTFLFNFLLNLQWIEMSNLFYVYNLLKYKRKYIKSPNCINKKYFLTKLKIN
jgi:hypothetical protein